MTKKELKYPIAEDQLHKKQLGKNAFVISLLEVFIVILIMPAHFIITHRLMGYLAFKSNRQLPRTYMTIRCLW